VAIVQLFLKGGEKGKNFKAQKVSIEKKTFVKEGKDEKNMVCYSLEHYCAGFVGRFR
jgi:hypothetical protein